MQQFARFLSFVFHPVFVPVYMVLLVYASDPYLQYLIPVSRMKPILLLLVVNTIIMPLLTFFYLKRKGVFTSLFLEEKSERKIGVLILFVFHFVTYVLWRKLELPGTFISLFLGILLSLLLVFSISNYFKISLHSLAFAGVVGAIIGLYRAHGFIDYSILAIAIMGLGLISSARLILHAHRPIEVNWGALCGFVLLYITASFTLYI